MNIQQKVTLFLALVLLAVFGVSTYISSWQANTLLRQSGDQSRGELKVAVYDQARRVADSLRIGTQGSVEQGEMDLFSELLGELGAIVNVEEVGLAGPSGDIDFSSSKKAVGTKLDQGAFQAALSAGSDLKEFEKGDTLVVVNPLRMETKCLQCHAGAKVGDLAGVLYLHYSLQPLRAAEAKTTELVSLASSRTVTTGLLVGGISLLLSAFGVYFLLGSMVRKPLLALEGMIGDMEKGHLGTRLNLTSLDEIGHIGRTMDAFTDSLQKDIVGSLEKLAAGDLTFKITPRDESDVVRHALLKVGKDLNAILGQVQIAGSQIASGSAQVSDSSQSLSQGATEQASSLEQITSSMTQMASQTRQNAENATQANTLAGDARQAADRGNTQMQQMVKAMGEINDSGQNISKIIKVIDEIAFQTNLLALNAAVEAARAGQHGKGFAVVAEEVRNLAARSAKAARETAELIEGSVKKAQNGSEIADKTAEALDEIVTGITKVTDLVAEIAASSNEQAQGIAQVNQGLGQIDQVTQQNTASAEQSAAAAEELSSQAEQLRQMLSHFRLSSQSGALSAPESMSSSSGGGAHGALGWAGMSDGASSGDLITWSPAFSVGITEIDRQHKKLVDLVNKLYRALKNGQGNEVLGGVLDELIAYTQGHFTSEERLMRNNNYPDFAAHKKLHDELVREVSTLKDQFASGKTTLSSDVFNFLKGWLVNHIQKQDKSYGPYLNSRGVF